MKQLNKKYIIRNVITTYIEVLKNYKLYSVLRVYIENKYQIRGSFYNTFCMSYQHLLNTETVEVQSDAVAYLIRTFASLNDIPLPTKKTDAEMQLFIMNICNIIIHNTIEPILVPTSSPPSKKIMDLLNDVGGSLFNKVCIKFFGEKFQDLTPNRPLNNDTMQIL